VEKHEVSIDLQRDLLLAQARPVFTQMLVRRRLLVMLPI
jgi:hypothetical protein